MGQPSDHLYVEVIDPSAALDEPLDDASSSSRGALLKKAIMAGGTLLAGGVVIGGFPRLATSAPSPSQDARILNFALVLEYLADAFYAEAAAKAHLRGELLQFARVVGGHERAHVAFLKKALGGAARTRPTLHLGDATASPDKFVAATIAIEDTTVAAYNGQAANLTKPTLAAAASIVSVEARHAGWIRAIADENPAPNATDMPVTPDEAMSTLKQRGYLRSS